jgi:hypothetical protein
MRQVRNRSTRVTSQIDRVFIPSSDDPSFIDATTREYALLPVVSESRRRDAE